MPSYTFVPLSAGSGQQGQGVESWQDSFTRPYASNRNAFRYGLLRAAPGQYAVYLTTDLSGRGCLAYVGVAYRMA